MRILNDQLIYSMSPHNVPVATVPSGSALIFETCDCFADQLGADNLTLDHLDWERINPATGPVYIEEAMPGDTLEVVIDDIKLSQRAVMVSGPGLGLGGTHLQNNRVREIQINHEDQQLVFSDNLKIPLNPMIGVIGTAPAEASITNGTPGAHGGNMDTRVIAKGSVLYLPVEVEGALLAMGDLHAAMGDGEIAVCGGEISGEVHVHVRVIKGRPYPLPFIRDAHCVYTVYSAESLDAAGEGAAKAMVSHLENKGLDPHDALCLLSLVGHLQVSQVVDPLKTARFALPRAYYDQL